MAKKKRKNGKKAKRQITHFTSKKIVEFKGSPTEHAQQAMDYADHFQTSRGSFYQNVRDGGGQSCYNALADLVDAAEMKRGIGISVAHAGRREATLKSKLTFAQGQLRDMVNDYRKKCVR
jgi:hypothetical protein